MKQKISADIDEQIMVALALGESGKDIAKRVGVSASYVSKLRTGKKIPSIKLVEPTLIKDEFFKVDNVSMTELLMALNSYDLIIDSGPSIEEYIEVQMKKCLIHAKMYQIILNKIKKEK